MDDRLQHLARLAGIDTGFTDAWGTQREVPASVVRDLAAALGYPSDTDQKLDRALADLEGAPWRGLLPPAFVARDGAAQRPVPLNLPAGAGRLEWHLHLESGETRHGCSAPDDLPAAGEHRLDGSAIVRRMLHLDALPDGYHRLVAECGGASAESLLIAAPETCFQPAASNGAAPRLTGLAVQLYGLRSGRNWGIGDFTDLGDLAASVAGCGIDAIGVNPLHALFPTEPDKTSPYSPSSRRFLNVLYIDVPAVPDFAECPEAQAMVDAPGFQARLAALRAAALVDYSGVAACKFPILELLYDNFRARHLAADTPRARAFTRFRDEGGEGLELFALHEVLAEHASTGKTHLVPWMHWPEELRDPSGPAARRCAREAADRVVFHIYLQWLAETQLAEAARRCRDAGLRVGIYGDLALGVDGAGGEAWADQGLYATGASVGAPPDVFSPKGQAWGLPPLRPDALRARAYEPFIALVRANMRHFGALRIDHALGLRRLYWIPHGGDATRGGYVSYPIDDLIAILKLESARNRCIVVGEDLGTVPPDLRDRLAAAGMLSYRLLYFERGEGGAFNPPAAYPERALVAITTHDLPPLAGWWSAADIATRESCGLFPSPDAAEDQRRERAHDRRLLIEALAAQDLLPPDFPSGPDLDDVARGALTDAAHLYLARTPSLLMMVGAEDLLGLAEQPNLPGTVDEHPNWRRKLPVALDGLRSNPHLGVLAAALPAAGR